MKKNKLTSTKALELLIEGNRRFSSGVRSVESFMSVSKMKELAKKGQSPFAIIISCSDSRVPSEMIFDQGLGDLFVIRVAGNVIMPEVVASLEFAVLNFGSPVCVVMGHLECGAVKAAFSTEADKIKMPTYSLKKLIAKIIPAVRLCKKKHAGLKNIDFLIREATICNVSRSVRLIHKGSPVVRKLVDEGKLMVVGAFYDLHTGLVTLDQGVGDVPRIRGLFEQDRGA